MVFSLPIFSIYSNFFIGSFFHFTGLGIFSDLKGKMLSTFGTSLVYWLGKPIFRDFSGYRSFQIMAIEDGSSWDAPTVEAIFQDFRLSLDFGTLNKLNYHPLEILEPNSFSWDKFDEIAGEILHITLFRMVFLKVLSDWGICNPYPLQTIREKKDYPIRVNDYFHMVFFEGITHPLSERSPQVREEFPDLPFLGKNLFHLSKWDQNREVNPSVVLYNRIWEVLKRYSFQLSGGHTLGISFQYLGPLFEKWLDVLQLRQKTGSYYTHPTVAQYMAKKSINYYLLGRLNQKISSYTPRDSIVSNPLPLSLNPLPLLTNLEEIDTLTNAQKQIVYPMLWSILSSITICDPCVGSGTLLQAAAEYLLEIYTKIQTFVNAYPYSVLEIFGENFPPEAEFRRKIVQSMLFGADLLETAVQMSKFRLWLWMCHTMDAPCFSKTTPTFSHTSPFFPLPSLSSHFSVGDALLNYSPPRLFDVILANPPYVLMVNIPKDRTEAYQQAYQVFHANGDLYLLFFELGFRLLQPEGVLCFISKRYYFRNPTCARLREFLSDQFIPLIYDFGTNLVFPGLSVETAILFGSHRNLGKEIFEQGSYFLHHPQPKNAEFNLHLEEPSYTAHVQFSQSLLRQRIWNFSSSGHLSSLAPSPSTTFPTSTSRSSIHSPSLTKSQTLISQFLSSSWSGPTLGEIAVLSKGIQTGKDKVFVITQDLVTQSAFEAAWIKPFLKGSDISPFRIHPSPKRLIYAPYHFNDQFRNASQIFHYLRDHREELRKGNRGKPRSRTKERDNHYHAEWFNWRQGDERITLAWDRPKIIGPARYAHPCYAIDTEGFYFSQDVVFIQPRSAYSSYLQFLVGLLNSPLMATFVSTTVKELKSGFYEAFPQQLALFPIILPPLESLRPYNLRVTHLQQDYSSSVALELNDLYLRLYHEFSIDTPENERTRARPS